MNTLLRPVHNVALPVVCIPLERNILKEQDSQDGPHLRLLPGAAALHEVNPCRLGKRDAAHHQDVKHPEAEKPDG